MSPLIVLANINLLRTLQYVSKPYSSWTETCTDTTMVEGTMKSFEEQLRKQFVRLQNLVEAIATDKNTLKDKINIATTKMKNFINGISQQFNNLLRTLEVNTGILVNPSTCRGNHQLGLEQQILEHKKEDTNTPRILVP